MYLSYTMLDIRDAKMSKKVIVSALTELRVFFRWQRKARTFVFSLSRFALAGLCSSRGYTGGISGDLVSM